MRNFLWTLSALFFIPLPVLGNFLDIPKNHPHQEAIAYVQNEGIVGGYDDGTFQPNRYINRAEFTKIIISAVTDQSDIDSCDTGILPFPQSDVGESVWFSPFICVAYQTGLITGYPDGKFRPQNDITLPEAAKIITLAYGKKMESSALWYEAYLRELNQSGAIPTEISDLRAPLTRGQVSEIIYRIKAEIKHKPTQKLESFGIVISPKEKIIETSTKTSTTEESQKSEEETKKESEAEPELPTTPLPEIVENNLTQNIEELFGSLDFLPPVLIGQIKDLRFSEPRTQGQYELVNRGNLYFYIKREGGTVTQSILLVKGEVVPQTVRGLWTNLQGSKLEDLILYKVKIGRDQAGINSSDLPSDLGEVVKSKYGGSLDLQAGLHALAQLTLHGRLRTAVDFMRYPTDNLQIEIGRALPSVTWQTGAAGVAEQSKKGKNFSEALTPTNYIQLTHNGTWIDPMDIKGLTVTDATLYYDSDNNIGWWGVGDFESNPYALYYQGPLVRSKDPRDYLAAQFGFGAYEITLGEYLKLNNAYQHRFAISPSEEADVVKSKKLALLASAINTLPLDVVKIKNPELENFKFKSGDKFPGPQKFNLVTLGPLATAKDGTAGPLIHVSGEALLFGKKFGQVRLDIDAQKASGSASGRLALDLGTVKGQSLGSLGGKVDLTINATKDQQTMVLKATPEIGPISGQNITINLHPDRFDFARSATCTLPFNINAYSNIATNKTLSVSDIAFIPQASLPDPQKLFSCREDLYFLIKDGVTIAMNGSVKLVEFANGFLPKNEVTKIGIKGLKFANGKIIEAPKELLNLAKQVPGVGELTDISNKLKDEAEKAAAQAAKKAAEAAKKAAQKAAEEARKAAERAAAEAARAAEAAINEGVKQLNNFVSNPAGAIESVGGVVGSVGSTVSGWFGGGGSSLPGFGWRGPYDPIRAIDIGVAHKLHPTSKKQRVWLVSETGYPLQVDDLGGSRFNFWYRNTGLSGNFPGFIRIDTDKDGYAAAVDKKGRLWTYNGSRWNLTSTYALDVGIGGGYIWITSTEPLWGSYKIYRAPYASGRTNFNWQYMNGAANKIDVGTDGRAWVINKAFEVWEWKNNQWNNRNGRAIDIAISESNRAWVLGAGDYNNNHGGARIYTYETCHWNSLLQRCLGGAPTWVATEGRAHAIGAGWGPIVWAVNSGNKVYTGTGRR